MVLLFSRSESPSRAFLAAVTSLYHHVTENSIPSEKWHKQAIVYDDLNRIKAARVLLPLRPPFDQLWLKFSKCLDVFHLRNHTRKECHTTYHPDNLKQLHPDLMKQNNQAAEQINAMVMRLKHTLNPRSRARQLFMLGWMAVHHNAYLARLGPPMLDCRIDGTGQEGGVSGSDSAVESE